MKKTRGVESITESMECVHLEEKFRTLFLKNSFSEAMDSQPSTSILREDDMKSEQLSSRGDKSSSDVVSEFMTELPPDLGEKLVEGSKFSK